MKIVQDPDIYSTWGVHGPFIQNWVFKCCYLVIIHVLTQLVPLRAFSLVALRIHIHMFGLSEWAAGRFASCLHLMTSVCWCWSARFTQTPPTPEVSQVRTPKVKPETLSQLQVESVTKYFLSSYKTSRSHVLLLLKYIYCQNCTFNIWDFYSSIIHTGDFCFSKVIF